MPKKSKKPSEVLSANTMSLSEIEQEIKRHQAEISNYYLKALDRAKLIGTLLIAAKKKVESRNWTKWVRDNTDFAERTTRKYIQLAENWDLIEAKRPHGAANLSINEALKLCAQTGKSRSDEATDGPAGGDTEQAESGEDAIEEQDDQVEPETSDVADVDPTQKPTTESSKPGSKPQAAYAFDQCERYTPPEIITLVTNVMGSIDLDPASSLKANEIVGADAVFTVEDDGLAKEWSGKVWLNPPSRIDVFKEFVDKALTHAVNDEVDEMILVTDAETSATWWHEAYECSTSCCFTKESISFIDSRLERGTTPEEGQSFFYFGRKPNRFRNTFETIGTVTERYKTRKTKRSRPVPSSSKSWAKLPPRSAEPS